MAGKYNDLETHGQPDGITAGVVAEHIAGNQPGASDYDVVMYRTLSGKRINNTV